MEYAVNSWNTLFHGPQEDLVFNDQLTEEKLDYADEGTLDYILSEPILNPELVINQLKATYNKFTKTTDTTYIEDYIIEEITFTDWSEGEIIETRIYSDDFDNNEIDTGITSVYTITDTTTGQQISVSADSSLFITEPLSTGLEIETWSEDNVPVIFDSKTTINELRVENENLFENTITLRIPNRFSLYKDIYKTSDPTDGGNVEFTVSGMLITPFDRMVYYTSDKELFKSGHAKTQGHYFYYDSDGNGFYETVYVLAVGKEEDIYPVEPDYLSLGYSSYVSSFVPTYDVIAIGYNYDGKHDFAPYERVYIYNQDIDDTDFDSLKQELPRKYAQNWNYDFSKLEDYELLFPVDDYDGFEPKDHIFEITKLTEMHDLYNTELYYEVRERVYEDAWEIYREQMWTDVGDQVFMMVTSTAVSAPFKLIPVVGEAISIAIYIVVYGLLTKFNIDFKAHEAESEQRSQTFLPEGGQLQPTKLNDRTFVDNVLLLGDSMPAALMGHPGAYYTTVMGGDVGNMYTAEAIASPPNGLRFLISLSPINIFGDIAYAFTLNPDQMYQMSFDNINLDYELVTSELYSYNNKPYYHYSSFATRDSLHAQYANNTIGYLEQRIREETDNELNTIKPVIIDGRPQYIFVDGENDIHQKTLPEFYLNRPIIVSQSRYNELTSADTSLVSGNLFVDIKSSFTADTEGIDSHNLLDLEKKLGYKTKIPLSEGEFNYPINFVTVEVIRKTMLITTIVTDADVSTTTSYFEDLLKKVEIPSSYYTLDYGNLYFSQDFEDIIFENKQEFNNLIGSSSYHSIFYRVHISFARIVPDSGLEGEQRIGLAQSSSYAIRDYFNQYTFACTTAQMISEIGYTEIMTLISTAISIPFILAGQWAVQGLKQAVQEGSTLTVKTALSQLFSKAILKEIIKAPVKEALEEIVMDGFIEAFFGNLVSMTTGNEDLSFWVTSLMTSVRESGSGPGRGGMQFDFDSAMYYSRDFRKQYSQAWALAERAGMDEETFHKEFKERMEEIYGVQQDSDTQSEAERSSWKKLIGSRAFRIFAGFATISLGSINLLTAFNTFKSYTTSIMEAPGKISQIITQFKNRKKASVIYSEVSDILPKVKTAKPLLDIVKLRTVFEGIDPSDPTISMTLLTLDIISQCTDPMSVIKKTPVDTLVYNKMISGRLELGIADNLATLKDKVAEVTESALEIKGENIEDNLIEMEEISEPPSIDIMAEKAGSVRGVFELDLSEYPDISWVLEDHDFVSFRTIGAEPETAIINAYIPTGLTIPEAEVYIKRRFFPNYDTAGIDIIFIADGQVLDGSGEINGFKYTSETEISEISAIVSEIKIMATKAMWGDRKNLPYNEDKKRGGDRLRNELGYTDDVNNIILTFADNCHKLFKGNFYNVFDFQISGAKENAKYEKFIANLDKKITATLNKHNVEKNLDSVRTFIVEQWKAKATNADEKKKEDEKKYLEKKAKDFFESFINTPYMSSSNREDTVSTIYKAFQINLMHILMETNDATMGIDTNKIFNELNFNLDNIDTIKYRGGKIDLDTVFYISVISTLLHQGAFDPWDKVLPHQFSYPTSFDSGIFTEVKGIIELKPQQLLDLREKGFEQYMEDILFSSHNDEDTINKFFLGTLYEDERDVKYWDCGGISYITNKKSGEYKSISTVSKQIDKTFHTSYMWVDSFNQIIRSVKDIKKYTELNMLNFIGEINYFGPMLNTRYGTICDFLSTDTISDPLKDILGRTRINDARTFESNPIWKKLSSTEYKQYEIIQNLNELVWENEGFDNTEENKEDFKIECLALIEKEMEKYSGRENRLSFLRDLRDNLDKYYAKMYDSQLNPRWGLVLDASIDSYLTSKDKVDLNDLLTKNIKRENIIGLRTDKGNLVGVYVWMYKISTDNEGNKIPIVGLKRIENFERIRDIVLDEGWILGALVRKGSVYESIPPILLTDLYSNRLYTRFELENGYMINKGDTWYRDHLDKIEDSTLFDLLSNGDKKMYGIRVLHSYFSRYGDIYHGVLVKMDHINTYLKYGIVIKPSISLCKDLESQPKSRLRRIQNAYEEFRSLENELKDTTGTRMSSMIREAEEFMEGENGIYDLVNFEINTESFIREIDIKDETLVKLNAFKKGGKIIDGPNKKEIANIFKKLIGVDPTNEKLYKICFNDFRRYHPQQEILEIFAGLIYRKDQSLKEWCCEILELFQDFESEDPSNPDEIDKIILKYQIALSKKSFSPLEDDREHFIKNGDYDDFILKDLLIDMMVSLFGRYTVISMLRGTIFIDEGIVRFVSLTYNRFTKTTIASGMILPWQYDAIKDHGKKPAMRLLSNRNLNKDDILERYYIDIYTQSVFFRSSSMLEIGDVYYDKAMIKIPASPLNTWMPAYSRTDEFKDYGMGFMSFLTLSNYNIRKYREWLENQ